MRADKRQKDSFADTSFPSAMVGVGHETPDVNVTALRYHQSNFFGN
jgi:hypothetical protein